MNDVIKIVIMSPGWGQSIFELPKPNDFIQAACGYVFLDEINNMFHPPPRFFNGSSLDITDSKPSNTNTLYA